MKVIVFGATGTIGRLAVANMLEAGHSVTAFARHPERLDIRHANLTLCPGDARDAADVADAVAGHDAVVVTLGAGAARKTTIRSEATLVIVQAMHRHGVRRLICQSTLGANDSWGNLSTVQKIVTFVMRLHPVFRDHALQEQIVRASGLDWTIVRPSHFTNGQATGMISEDFSTDTPPRSMSISRGDVAAFLARQLGETRYLHRAVGISA